MQQLSLQIFLVTKFLLFKLSPTAILFIQLYTLL